MKDLTIVIVNDFAYINGGSSNVAIESAIGLSKDGYKIIFFAAVLPIDERLKHSNINIVCTEQHEIIKDPSKFRAFFQGVWNFKAAKRLNELLLTLDPVNTIVHFHGWTKALSSSVIKASKKLGFKTVITLHDYFLSCPNGGYFNYRKREICKLRPMSFNCICKNCDKRSYLQKVWRVIRQLVQQKIAKVPEDNKNIIYISKFSREVISPFLEGKFYYVKNPINVNKVEPIEVENNNLFVSIGRISEEKGMDLFAQACKVAKCNGMIIGDGEAKEKVKQVNSEIVCTGWLEKDQVYERLSKARALVVTSLLYETMGLVAGEAIAMGIPVIVPDMYAAKELIEDNKTGLIYKSKDISDLVSKIRMLQNNELAKAIGKAAYESYWNDDFSIETHIRMLKETYKSILDEKIVM